MKQITVIGVGGCGSNILRQMQHAGVNGDGVKLVVVDSDPTALAKCEGMEKLRIGANTTGGRSACGNPETGMLCAKESKEALMQLLADTEIAILVCGMGGGTGSGATPVIAEWAKELGCLTLGVAITAFKFEGTKREENATAGTELFRDHVNALLLLSNDSYIETFDMKARMSEVLGKAAEPVIQMVHAMKGIQQGAALDIPSEEIKEITETNGGGYIGVGEGVGPDGCLAAAKQAIAYLQENTDLSKAKSILINVYGDSSFLATNEAVRYIQGFLNEDTNILFGVKHCEVEPEFANVFVIAMG